MKKIKYIIIFLIVLIIILLSIVFVLNKNMNTSGEGLENEEMEQGTLMETENHSTKEENDNVFFTINDIIQNEINDGQYYGQEIYKLQYDTCAMYYTYGLILKDEKIEEYYLKVNVDYNNNAFITEELSTEEFNKAKNGEIKEISVGDITKTTDNAYSLKNFSTEDIARRYIKDYTLKVKYLPNTAYELLEDTYKAEKFKTIYEFKDYVQKNENRFQSFVMSKYGCETLEGSKEYTVLDQNDMYYKLIVYDTLNYKIILDNYTIETEEYVEEYNNASEKTKVDTCISKFIKMLNAKEYSQIYNYLDDTFKQNNFNTLKKFESYMESHMFDYNIATLQSQEKIGDIYHCKLKIKSGVGLSAEEKNITVVMKLKEGTDFVMSFNVD